MIPSLQEAARVVALIDPTTWITVAVAWLLITLVVAVPVGRFIRGLNEEEFVNWIAVLPPVPPSTSRERRVEELAA